MSSVFSRLCSLFAHLVGHQGCPEHVIGALRKWVDMFDESTLAHPISFVQYSISEKILNIHQTPTQNRGAPWPSCPPPAPESTHPPWLAVSVPAARTPDAATAGSAPLACRDPVLPPPRGVSHPCRGSPAEDPKDEQTQQVTCSTVTSWKNGLSFKKACEPRFEDLHGSTLL